MARRYFQQKWQKVLPAVTFTLTAAPFVVHAPTAAAFFPPLWPISPPVTVVPPIASPPVVVPPTVPPVVVEPPIVPPVVVEPPVSPPSSNTIPEPATVISGLVGLAALAGYRLSRRGQQNPDSMG
ncbi:MAG: hypothetical protein RMJ56_10025 [Gemmataceae bacterium]|nr:hypothetical protein [Gemmata sp.]MDW8197927.1 hypothetical protein [Gemmataceae bacterium]